MKSHDHFLPVTGQWFASSLSMLVSRKAFERYRGLGSEGNKAGISSTSFQFKKHKRHPDGPPADAHSQDLLSPAWPEMKQVVGQPSAAGCWGGVRSVAKEDIKWNIKAADTKQTSPGNRDSTHRSHHGACLGAGLYEEAEWHSLWHCKGGCVHSRLNAAQAVLVEWVNSRSCLKSWEEGVPDSEDCSLCIKC